MTSALIIVAALYLAARLYSSLKQTQPENLIAADGPRAKFAELSGAWWFLLPVASAVVIIYNAGAYILWFALELTAMALRALRWIWNEIILGGFGLVARLLLHYFILWPWKLFRLTFEQWPHAWKRNSYLWASLSLFVALALAFTGKYFAYLAPDLSASAKSAIGFLFNLLAILPIGVCGAWIAYQRQTGQRPSGLTFRYLKWAGVLLGSLGFLFAIQWILIFAGTHSSFRSTFTSLASAGSLASSLLMWFNALLALFAISALPSFSNNYNGSVRDFFPTFFRHVRSNWATYLAALPVLLIPAYLLTLVPLMISQGVSYMSMKVTHDVHESRIHGLEEKLENKMEANYNDWCNRAGVSEDSLSALMANDMEQAEVEADISSLRMSSQRMDSAYSRYSYMYGAVPAGLLIAGYDSLTNLGSRQLRVEAVSSEPADSTAYDAPMQAIAQSRSASENSQKANEVNLDQLRTELANVCPEPDTTSAAAPLPEDATVVNPADTTQIDYCEMQRKEIRTKITATETVIDSIRQDIERMNQVEAHIVAVKDRKMALHAQENTSGKISYGILSLILALVISFGLGMVLSLFSNLNAEIYRLAGNEPHHIISEIEAARSRNPNQPILGFTAVAIALLWYCNASFTSPSTWVPSGKAKAKEIWADPAGQTKQMYQKFKNELKSFFHLPTDESGTNEECCAEGEASGESSGDGSENNGELPAEVPSDTTAAELPMDSEIEVPAEVEDSVAAGGDWYVDSLLNTMINMSTEQQTGWE
jgi:hypothetical protein